MSEVQVSPALGREDFGDLTVLRVKVPTLPSDETTEALFRQAASVVEEAGRTRLVLNLDGVVFLASAALGQLVTLMRKVLSAGGRLVLCKVNRRIEEVLQVTHLAEVMLVYTDEQEALRSFA
jgi:anti-sigma B factor antagonist